METIELSDAAERILFATSLEEKLHSAALISDERPRGLSRAPAAPGRPIELQFKGRDSRKTDFPGIHALEKEENRGRLLHFFANHELLATELMALVLLRFPEAPAAFRRGVYRTLQEEQGHTRLYLERMRQCGVEFGALPVSGYFWRAVSTMRDPMDYVTALSLTFEQANLDFCQAYAAAFLAAGDSETARLLDSIYQDEIAHVAYGLKWFRRWKTPGQSDWKAYARQLHDPLSPQRAKGLLFNIDGRKLAGFDSEFIDELNVYARSKGRTPTVFWFNPFAEASIAAPGRFSPTEKQNLLARDLDNLPQFLCRQDDIVLVQRRPSTPFLNSLKEAGWPIPEFVELGDKPLNDAFGERKLGGLRPWAWAPDSLELLTPLGPRLAKADSTPADFFNDAIAPLYAKSWSVQFLQRVLVEQRQHDAEQWLAPVETVGVAVGTVEEALAAVRSIRSRPHHAVIVKQSLGLAGQNAIRLLEPEILPAQRRWIERSLSIGPLIVEPWLDRLFDFSIQFEMTPRGLNLCGFTGLLTDPHGRYQGNWASSHCGRRLPQPVARLLRKPADIALRLGNLYGDIAAPLAAELRRVNYFGPIGIDAFVYRDAAGDNRLKPVVEINPRHTMGRLTLELMRRVAPGCCGVLRLQGRGAAEKAGFPDFASYAREWENRFPRKTSGEPLRKMVSGALPLNDPERATVCLALFLVGPDVWRLLEASVTRSR